MYVGPLRLPPPIFAGTAVYFFAATNYMKVIPYYYLGQFSAENLMTAAVLVPVAIDRFGADPAVASSVFVTMMTDTLGFLSFLGLATLVGVANLG